MTKEEATKQLYRAIRENKLIDCQRAIDAGADLTGMDNIRWTPLHEAAWAGNVAVVKLLIERGSDIDARDDHQFTPLHAATWEGRAKVAEFLIENGADVNAKDERGFTPLDWAKKTGKHEIVSEVFSKTMHNQTSHADRIAQERTESAGHEIGG